jgi:tRNA threonylcarbamoyl adenosine modification protein YeaZ
MKILALELSTARGSIAALNDDVDPSTALRACLAREWANDRKHSGLFFENLQEVTNKFRVPEMIVVGLGPGSYAGIRIAISAAIGLQQATGARLVGLPSTCAFEAEEYCVIGDARRDSFFFARVAANELTEGPTLLSEAELRTKLDKLESNMSIFCSEQLQQFERVIVRYPSAKVLARLAQDPNRRFALPPLEPMYLREPYITVPRGIGIPANGDSRAGSPRHNS